MNVFLLSVKYQLNLLLPTKHTELIAIFVLNTLYGGMYMCC